MQKTIFITIARSFITRNILRSGILDLLKQAGYKIVIFFHASRIPGYIVQEFADDQVELIALPLGPRNMPHRFLMRQYVYLISTTTSRMLVFYKERLKQHLMLKKLPLFIALLPHARLLFLKVMSNMPFLKAVCRYVDFVFFPEKDKDITDYFDRYNPDIVLSTSIDSRLDVAILKEAKRRKVTTVSMPKSWDCLHTMYYRFVPDYFLAPNNISKQVVIDIQDIPAKRISVVGLPQFDWYGRKSIIKSREEYCRDKGFDPGRSLIFFGSEGIWANHDVDVAAKIYEWVVNDELARPCQLLARPHYSNCDQDIFRAFRGKPGVFVDNYRVTGFLPDKWDPSKEEMIDFINSLYHCDVMINIASTLTLDAAGFDKPIINVNFGGAYEEGNKNGRDVTWMQYESDHFKLVLETGATKKVDTPSELKEQINNYLLNPQLDAQERSLLVKKLCFKLDGRASERIVAVLSAIADGEGFRH